MMTWHPDEQKEAIYQQLKRDEHGNPAHADYVKKMPAPNPALAPADVYRVLRSHYDEAPITRDDLTKLSRQISSLSEAPPHLMKRIERMEVALRWIVDNPGAHPMNMWRVAQDALRSDQ